MAKKSFFESRTDAEISHLANEHHASNNLIQRIVDLDENDFLVIDRTFIPEKFSSPNKFKKHAPEVKLRRFSSVTEAISMGLTPVLQRQEVFDKLHEIYRKNSKGGFYSGYTFRPIGVDERLRKVPLVYCLEAARILKYCAEEPGADITIEPYDSSRIRELEGGSFVFNVPSRTEKKPRHNLCLESIAVVDSPQKYSIALAIDSDHSCKDKRYTRKLRSKFMPQKGRALREHSGLVVACPHDIAAYWSLTDRCWNDNKNIIPLMMNPFAIPTQYSVDFYKKLLNNVLIKDIHRTGKYAGKEYTRKLNQAEQEALLWGLVMHDGHDKTFFAREKLKDYNWGVEK